MTGLAPREVVEQLHQYDLANAGATVLDQPVVVDENVITSRFIYGIPQFIDAIVAQLN